ncbi:MAG: hypothetical protein Ct9H300mP1_16320 [Planctomycetaceae bacterium]|nr:MAG: hypothetical protein Ct9H300mP1_16320 [Planctomycetaceae bacterium]
MVVIPGGIRPHPQDLQRGSQRLQDGWPGALGPLSDGDDRRWGVAGGRVIGSRQERGLPGLRCPDSREFRVDDLPRAGHPPQCPLARPRRSPLPGLPQRTDRRAVRLSGIPSPIRAWGETAAPGWRVRRGSPRGSAGNFSDGLSAAGLMVSTNVSTIAPASGATLPCHEASSPLSPRTANAAWSARNPHPAFEQRHVDQHTGALPGRRHSGCRKHVRAARSTSSRWIPSQPGPAGACQ